jgi:histidine triad (HIT) family protein
MPSVFSQIVAGELPCYKVAETKDFLAFLDIRPLSEGHTLVIPKKEVDYLFDLEDELYVGLQLFAKAVAVALGKSVTCARIGTAVVGLEVPHAHIHLIPINAVEDLNFANDRLEFSNEQFAAIADRIRENL